MQLMSLLIRVSRSNSVTNPKVTQLNTIRGEEKISMAGNKHKINTVY